MRNLLIIAFGMCTFFMTAQNVTIDGYVYENGNRGYLNTVLVKAYNGSGEFLDQSFSDIDGHFVLELANHSSYKLVTSKDMFHSKEIDILNGDGKSKLFAKVEMKRAPGYLFEITLANKREEENQAVDAIKGADIEVYNNTTKKMILSLENYANPNFEVPLLKENHYTLFVRKQGYLSKRMEAFVNVKGCILCFEGIGEVKPGVSDNLTEGNETGVLLANVEMEAIYAGKELQIKNLYYETGSAEILPQSATVLDNLITILKDNPNLRVELGSHTDSRGLGDKNMILSQKRAKSAADYIFANSDISKSILSYRGYGEDKLLNKCTSFVDCTDAEHAINRRTEITVLGIDPLIELISLEGRIKQDEQDALIWELMNQEQVKVTGDEKPSFLDENNSEDKVVIEQKESAEKLVEKREQSIPTETLSMKDIVESANVSEEDQVMDSYFTVIYYFSRKPLSESHKVRTSIQGYREYTTESGSLLYHVGEFQEESKAVQFMNDQIKSAFPGAYISYIKNGKLSNSN